MGTAIERRRGGLWRDTKEGLIMEIIDSYPVPTGDILVVDGDYGKLECLSLGDYGKEVNLKCDAMGLSRDPNPVRHTALLPLEEKWVVTISTQYGCSMHCQFCDVPRVGPGENASFADLVGQVKAAIDLHPEIRQTKRLNLHYARMGEPSWNPAVLLSAVWLHGKFCEIGWGFHPVISTMMPCGNIALLNYLTEWMVIKNEVCGGNAGLQLSINSTDDQERRVMFRGSCLELDMISRILRNVPRPVGRKITLNFAVANYTVDASKLASLFSPEFFVCKLTPMHKTASAKLNDIATEGDCTTYEPYKHLEESLKAAGFDVLVFIASHEEDDGRITCGNAILADAGLSHA